MLVKFQQYFVFIILLSRVGFGSIFSVSNETELFISVSHAAVLNLSTIIIRSDMSLSSRVEINNTSLLYLKGFGHSIDAGYNTQCFKITGVSSIVHVEDLTIKNGYALKSGHESPGFYVADATVYFKNVIMLSCWSQGGYWYYPSGGAFSMEQGTVSFVNTVFRLNGAYNGYYTSGGAVAIRHGNASFENCSFSNNYVQGYYSGYLTYGGDIFIRESHVQIKNSFFNSIRGYGYFEGPSDGGSIYAKYSDVLIENSTFIGYISLKGGAVMNEESKMETIRCNFSNGYGYWTSGAVQLHDSDQTFRFCSFKNNHGGVLYVKAGTTYVIDSILEGGTAEREGGAILIVQEAVVTIVRTVIYGSSCAGR